MKEPKTHCAAGHDLRIARNVRITFDRRRMKNRRDCRACHNIRRNRHNAEIRAQGLASRPPDARYLLSRNRLE